LNDSAVITEKVKCEMLDQHGVNIYVNRRMNQTSLIALGILWECRQ
jgi:hypothetical protein